jgi:hypothetical protein
MQKKEMQMKQLSKRIPFRPMPIAGELFKGYIVRLASRNGRDELKDFVNAFGISGGAKKIYVVGTLEHEEFLSVLSASMGVDRDKLATGFAMEKEIQMLDWLSTRHVLVNQPRICPTCMTEHGHLKEDWHLYYATHCHVHECKLWNSCPRCGSTFNWKGKLLMGCTHCNLKWKDVSPVKAKLPSSQVALSKTVGAKKLELIGTILNSLKIGLRPFDASFQKPRDIDDYVPDMEPHVEQAFQVAHSKRVVAKLKSARKQHWQSKVGGRPQVALFDMLDAVNDAVFDEVQAQSAHNTGNPIKPKEASHMVLSAHRRLNSDPDKACLELSWDQLEGLLKMDEPHIKSLIKQGIIPGRMHANSPGKVSPSRIDDVIGFYRNIKKRSFSLKAANDDGTLNNLIAWGDDKALSKYKINTKELAMYVSTGELPIYGPAHHDHLFEDFRFCPVSLNKQFGTNSANTSANPSINKQSA